MTANDAEQSAIETPTVRRSPSRRQAITTFSVSAVALLAACGPSASEPATQGEQSTPETSATPDGVKSESVDGSGADTAPAEDLFPSEHVPGSNVIRFFDDANTCLGSSKSIFVLSYPDRIAGHSAENGDEVWSLAYESVIPENATHNPQMEMDISGSFNQYEFPSFGHIMQDTLILHLGATVGETAIDEGEPTRFAAAINVNIGEIISGPIEVTREGGDNDYAVDFVRLEAPGNWKKQYIFDRNGTLTEHDVPGEINRGYIVTPDLAIWTGDVPGVSAPVKQATSKYLSLGHEGDAHVYSLADGAIEVPSGVSEANYAPGGVVRAKSYDGAYYGGKAGLVRYDDPLTPIDIGGMTSILAVSPDGVIFGRGGTKKVTYFSRIDNLDIQIVTSLNHEITYHSQGRPVWFSETNMVIDAEGLVPHLVTRPEGL